MKCNDCCWFESQLTEPTSYGFKSETQRFIEVGICRKHPPQQFVFPSTGETSCGWPTTRSTDWCGEWEDNSPVRATTSGIVLDDRIVQILKNWRDTHNEKPMPRWKLRRSIGDNEAELVPALERLVKNGSVEIVLLQTKGRPFSSCKLT